MNTTPSPATAGGVLQVLREALAFAREVASDEQLAEAYQALSTVEVMAGAAQDFLNHPHDAEGVNLAARDRLATALAAFGSAAPAGDDVVEAALLNGFPGLAASLAAEQPATPAGGGGELPEPVAGSVARNADGSVLVDNRRYSAEQMRERDRMWQARLASTGSARSAWRPMETAPRDGTMLRLLVEFTEHATEDSPGPSPTIGANNFDNDGEDRWQFAGWCWTHDHFTQGQGKPVGWLPMLDDAGSAPAPSAPDWNMAQHWIDRYASGVDDELQLDRIADALGLPDPTDAAPTQEQRGPSIVCAGCGEVEVGIFDPLCPKCRANLPDQAPEGGERP